MTARASAPDPLRLLHHAVHQALHQAFSAVASAPVAIALSGGRDSVALLDAAASTRDAHGHPLVALHVHHGLSARADAWAAFCTDLCSQTGIPLTVLRVDVARTAGTSLENEARIARYRALSEAATKLGATHVLLGHHRDDQIETLLLQLLRGAGPHGLAAMAATRQDAGINWLRPLLDLSRATIDAYVAQRNLRFVEDESNADPKHLRNAVRQTVMPALASVHAASGTTLARAAQLQGEAAHLADDLAAIDASAATTDGTLAVAALASLPPHRARNLLRWHLRQQGLPAPSSARLAAMLNQLRHPRPDAQVRLLHAGVELGVHQGRIVVHSRMRPMFDLAWHGEPALALPHGRLVFACVDGAGLDAAQLSRGAVRVRSRAGGERIQLAPNRPRRALKSILQEEGVPAWERASLPLVFCNDVLAAIPGFGIDTSFLALPGHPGVTVTWHPA